MDLATPTACRYSILAAFEPPPISGGAFHRVVIGINFTELNVFYQTLLNPDKSGNISTRIESSTPTRQTQAKRPPRLWDATD
jgi:hypothetical protein